MVLFQSKIRPVLFWSNLRKDFSQIPGSLKPIKFDVRSVFCIFLNDIRSIAKIGFKCSNFFGRERVWEKQSESRRKRESRTILNAPGLALEKI